MIKGIVCLLLLVFFHELGHFIAAKACKVKVNEFSVGFGPALIKKEHHGTLYAIRLVPLGGYCSMEDEYGTEEKTANSFSAAAWWKKILIFFAGPFVNILLGFLILLPAFCLSSVPYATTGIAASDLELIQPGDEIVQIDDFHIYTPSDIVYAEAFAEAAGHPGQYDITVMRAGEEIALSGFAPEGGLLFENLDFELVDGMADRAGLAARNFASIFQSTFLSFKHILLGDFGLSDMSGPVGIVSSYSAQASMTSILLLTSMISVNLGVVNLIPIPALDGGRILITLIERLRNKELSPKMLENLSYLSLSFILLLFICVTASDIFRLI